MPTRLPARRADRRITEFTRRIEAAQTERMKVFALVGWLMAEYYKQPAGRRLHWDARWQQLALEMNEEVRHDGQ